MAGKEAKARRGVAGWRRTGRPVLVVRCGREAVAWRVGPCEHVDVLNLCSPGSPKIKYL